MKLYFATIFAAIAAAVLCSTAAAQSTAPKTELKIEISSRPWTAYKGSTIIKPRKNYPTRQECMDSLPKTAVGNWACKGQDDLRITAVPVVVAPPPPPPPPPPVVTPPVTAMSPGLGRLPANPRITDGAAVDRLQPTSERPNPSDIGAFRLQCAPSHFAFDDPIVYPGQPGRSHMHTFFGNTGVTGNTTIASLTTTGNATCNGGTVNRSGYWVPSMIDTRTMLPLVPTLAWVYYKTGYNGVRPQDIQPYPVGLRMIAGDPVNREEMQWGSPYQYTCHNNPHIRGQSIVQCPVGDELVMQVFFPQCWDGRNLDAPDHKSHMAYPQGGCPPSHPVALTEVSFHVHYHVENATQWQHLRLSSDQTGARAGTSAHADWMNGWRPEIMEAWTRGCSNASADCHGHLLGNGQLLY
jgi:hypothetical protein